MTLDPRAARFLDMAAAGRKAGAVRDLAERRAALARLMGFARAARLAPAGSDLILEEHGHAVPARLYRPEAAIHDGITLFLHGGGLVAGGIDTHEIVARGLAAASGGSLLSVGYRLAPEHPFPAANEDTALALRWRFANAERLGIAPSRIALCGESGGASLAVVAAHEAARQHRPALLMLICPVLDFSRESASRSEFANGYLIDRETLEADLADYLGDRGVSRSHPRVSPLLLDDLSRLPPTVIHTAQYDPLRDEGEAFARRLVEAGVHVTHHAHTGMVHNFHALGALLPQGQAALESMGAEIAAALGFSATA